MSSSLGFSEPLGLLNITMTALRRPQEGCRVTPCRRHLAGPRCNVPARVPHTVAQVGDLLEALLQSLLDPQKLDKLRVDLGGIRCIAQLSPVMLDCIFELERQPDRASSFAFCRAEQSTKHT